MDVFQLKATVGAKATGGCRCGGMALVAAPNFTFAKNMYLLKGIQGEMYYYGEFDFNDRYSAPIEGLEWHGEACIICESIHLE